MAAMTSHANQELDHYRTWCTDRKAPSRLGARASTLCPGTKRNVCSDTMCPKFRFNLLRCCHLVTAITSNHNLKHE